MARRWIILFIMIIACLNRNAIFAQNDLSKTGPWLIFMNNKHQFGVANADGTTPTLITALNNLRGSSVRIVSSPQHNYAAYLIDGSDGIDLYIVQLPDLTVKLIAQPFIPETEQPKDYDIEVPLRAILHGRSVVWSPSGDTLAFTGKPKGTTSEIFLYSTKTGQVIQLTTTKAQPESLYWSPDGKYIVYPRQQVPGSNSIETSLWVIDVQTRKTTKLFEIDPNSNFYIDSNFLRWVTPSTFTIAYSGMDCAAYEARTFDLDTMTMKVLYPAYFDEFVYAPTVNKLLIAVSGEYPCTINTPQPAGIYILSSENKSVTLTDQPSSSPTVDWTTIQSTKIADYSSRNSSSSIYTNFGPPPLGIWDPIKGVFFLYQGENQISEVTPDGKVTELPPSPVPFDFLFSEDGQYVVGVRDQALLAGQPTATVGICDGLPCRSPNALVVGHAPDFKLIQTTITNILDGYTHWVPQEQDR